MRFQNLFLALITFAVTVLALPVQGMSSIHGLIILNVMHSHTGTERDGNGCNIADGDDDGDYVSARMAVPEPGCVAKRTSVA